MTEALKEKYISDITLLVDEANLGTFANKTKALLGFNSLSAKILSEIDNAKSCATEGLTLDEAIEVKKALFQGLADVRKLPIHQ